VKRYTVLVKTPRGGYEARNEWAFTAADAREQVAIKLTHGYPNGGWQIHEVRPNSLQGES
jgi:hypothetical protein